MRKVIFVLFLPLIIAGSFACCSVKSEKSSVNINSIESYREIPGVTNEEIAAIELLKTTRRGFSFGTMPTTEAFILPDGSYEGFTVKFCALLSGLFDIPFVPEFHSWDYLLSGINDKTIDFTGELTATPERKLRYLMTSPIAERYLAVFTKIDSVTIETELDLNMRNLGFLDCSIIDRTIMDVYPTLVFEAVFLNDILDAVEYLETGKIDAFISDEMDSYAFSDYPQIHSRKILPLIYSSVSLTTMNPELEPVISVMDKYIEAGGIDNLYKLYTEGNSEYLKYEFSKLFNNEERAYLERLAANGTGVPVALEHDNYPMSFFDNTENKFQGIAPDILAEVSRLTGIVFETITGKNTAWTTIIESLRSGEAALVSELLYSEERKDNFLWSNCYASSHYALLSKSDYPSLEMHQVIRATAGLVRETAYEEVFKVFFPNNTNVKYYDTQNDALDALENGEIDLLMASENVLLMIRNYREKLGYKINILFNTPLDRSFFGFNKNEKLLCSIFRKSQSFINTGKIEADWTNRIYDYSKKMAEERFRYISKFAAILLLLLITMIILFFKNIKTRELYKNQMLTLSTIYMSLPDLVYSKDINGAYTSCNHSFEKFAGCSEPDIIGKTSIALFKDRMDMAKNFAEMDKNTINVNSITKAEEWFIYPDRSTRFFENVKVPLVRDGRVIGIIGIARDITEHKEAETAAQEASRAKSSFLARMSHEIRTPMNAIIGMAELAMRAKDLDSAHEHIVTVKQAGAHLLAIINDILDLSKIETGKLEILPGDYSFSSLLNDVVSIIRMKVIDSQIKFAVNIDRNIPNLLIGDETRIRQVMLNILSNAVKYTEKGFVSFSIYGEKIDEETIRLFIEVMDSGKGIKEEDIENLFDEYVQMDMEKNKGIEGIGLGLAITRNIVTAMGGEIKVHSVYGKGSLFTILLPQKIRSHEALASVKTPEKISVIVYERREFFANSIVYTVDNLGVECTLVSDDAELCEELENQSFSFIFISYFLLEKNRDIISKHAADSKIVVLAEFGEVIPDKKTSILAMPAYAISVANILNGVSESFNFIENEEGTLGFTAPDAKILVVDDISTNLKVAEGLMLPYKMQVDLCKSGRQSIEEIKKTHYDLIFMDHKMPDMDGAETTLYIRKMESEDQYYKNVPIIALTANAISGIKEELLQNGFNDYLTKPIDTIMLNTVLEKWIPREKKKTRNERGLVTMTEEGDIGKKINVPGLDVKRGVFLSGGTHGLYLETLEIFYKDGLEKLGEIRSCMEKARLDLYTIHVHALKSASANIGAGELSEKAKALELAGERKDWGFIETHTPDLLVSLKILLKDINAAISKYKSKNDDNKKQFDMEIVGKELAKLKAALETLDAGTINITIEGLREIVHADDIETIVNGISEKILIGEFDEAIALIEPILQERK